MEIMDTIGTIASFDLGIISEIPKYIMEKYKDKNEREGSKPEVIVTTAVACALENEYHSFKISGIKSPKELIRYVDNILDELNIKDIKIISNEKMISDFVNKFRHNNIIEVEAINGDSSEYDIDQFYIQFQRYLKKILGNKVYETDTNYKRLLMELMKSCTDDVDYIRKNIKLIKELLESCKAGLDILISKNMKENDNQESKIMVISRGNYNEEEYSRSLDLRKYFDNRHILDNKDWEQIRQDIVRFAEELKTDFQHNKHYKLYLNAHLSIAYCMGVCLNGKGDYSINVMQNIHGNVNDWRIDASKEEVNFKDNLFNIEGSDEILDQEKRELAICISTLNNSIGNDVKEYINANNISIRKVIDFNLGDRGGNGSVKSGTHAWFLSSQIRKILDKRNISERKEKVHIFMAGPVSMAFFLGQLSVLYKNIVLYEHTGIDDAAKIYAPSIFIENADSIS